MLTPPPAPVKTFSCNFSTGLRHKDTGHTVIATLPCDCWKCPKCTEARLKPFWCEHLSILIGKHSGPIYVVECSTKDADTVRRRFNRAEADYLRVKAEDGSRVLFFGTERVKGSLELTAEEAIERACNAIWDCNSLKRGVSTSRPWKRPAKPESKYEMMAVTNKDLTEATVELAKERGIKVTKRGDSWIKLETPDFDEAQSRQLFVDICFKNAEMHGECPVYSSCPGDESGPTTKADIESDIWRLSDAEIDAMASLAV
jgi:hypothetical protein